MGPCISPEGHVRSVYFDEDNTQNGAENAFGRTGNFYYKTEYTCTILINKANHLLLIKLCIPNHIACPALALSEALTCR